MLLVKDPRAEERLLPRANKPWLRLLARMFDNSLDHKLASGVPPESRPMLAARAEKLVSPAWRLALAENWQDLLEQSHAPRVQLNSRVRPCHGCIVASEGDVRLMLNALSAARPSSARRRGDGEPVAERRSRSSLQPAFDDPPGRRAEGGDRPA